MANNHAPAVDDLPFAITYQRSRPPE